MAYIGGETVHIPTPDNQHIINEPAIVHNMPGERVVVSNVQLLPVPSSGWTNGSSGDPDTTWRNSWHYYPLVICNRFDGGWLNAL